MPTFSIYKSSSLSPMQQYSAYMADRIFYNIQDYDYNDPNFLSKLSVIQAENIRQEMQLYNRIGVEGFSSMRDNLSKLRDVTISSLENGFLQQNCSLCNLSANVDEGFSRIGQKIDIANSQRNTIINNIQHLEDSLNLGFNKLFRANQITNLTLNSILSELRIPEFLREKRYHIEQALKYLKIGYKSDALDEFQESVRLDRSDWFSWQQIGLIEFSRMHFDEAIESLNNFLHFSAVENVSADKINDAKSKIALIHYIKGNPYLASTNAPSDMLRIKYLSACDEDKFKKEAARCLEDVLEYSPFSVMQVFEDADMHNNKFIVELIYRLRDKIVLTTKLLYNQIQEKLISSRKEQCRNIESLQSNINKYQDSCFYCKMTAHFSKYKEEYCSRIKRIEGKLKEAHSLLEKNTYLDAICAESILSKEIICITNLNIELEKKYNSLFRINELNKDYNYLKKYESNDVFVNFVESRFNGTGYFCSIESLKISLEHLNSSYSYSVLEYLNLKDIYIQILEYQISGGSCQSSSKKVTRHYNDIIASEYKKLCEKLKSRSLWWGITMDYFDKRKNYVAIGYIIIWRGYTGEDKKYIRRAIRDAKLRNDKIMASRLKKILKDSKSGCYIATAVYGSYDAPEVRVLRKFRDTVLSKTLYGRMFIKTYYAISPPLAKRLHNHSYINRFVKRILDKWVSHLCSATDNRIPDCHRKSNS